MLAHIVIVFLPFLVFFNVIDYLHGHPSSIDLFFLLFIIIIIFFFQASTSDLSIQKENNETTFTIGESRTISNANDTQAQQVAPTSLSTAKATRTTRDRGTEEQETGISEAL